ncbi:hypothetical protein J2S07_000503 [Robertmurraya andreesenii]|uniref:Uncharacterized protein n=1 Tax=Anoxybacillus andreesenii TaxID=1325932 RepID=A0ABT9UZS8_9BACL|nr:hypothetical protein [Robertmurraya andreesenii]
MKLTEKSAAHSMRIASLEWNGMAGSKAIPKTTIRTKTAFLKPCYFDPY